MRVVDSLLELMKEAVTREKFDTAKQLGTAAFDVARKSRNSAFIKETAARQGTIIKQMAEIQKAQVEVVEAIDALNKNPIDPAANLVVGAYRCFLQGDWNRGISMLALGVDPALKDLALKELNGVTDAVEQAKTGDAWWDLGEKKNALTKKNIQDHAAYWYQQALPGLTGLVKEKVEKRLQEGKAVKEATASTMVRRVALRGHLLPGLVGEYFTGHDFNHPIEARIDSRPAMDWANAHSVVPKEHFSIRWTGWIIAPKAGRYVIAIASDGGHRLWLDGKRMAELWKGGDNNRSETAAFLGDKPHLVCFEYYQDSGPKYLTVKWRSEGSTTDVDLPAEILFHTPGPLDGKERGK